MARATGSAGGSPLPARRSSTSVRTSLRSSPWRLWPFALEPPSWWSRGDAADGLPSGRSRSRVPPLDHRSQTELPRPEVRPVDRQERDRVDEEQDEPRDDGRRRQLSDEDQHDRSEPDDRGERDGPGPQLTPQDSDARPECDDRRVAAQERVTGGVETGPQ